MVVSHRSGFWLTRTTSDGYVRATWRALDSYTLLEPYQTFRTTNFLLRKDPEDLSSNTPVSGAMPKRLKSSARADQSYSPLISAPETHDNCRRDVEAVYNENVFSLLYYFGFFVIGLSMMWTWYT